MPHTPVSEKRLAANRANAARSTGPQSPEGKARSAQNARKHGFTASKFAVVRLEELDALDNLRADAIATYQPLNSQELFAVERIALAQQSLLRVAQLEAGLHTSALNETMSRYGSPLNLISEELAGDLQVSAQQNRSLRLATGFMRIDSKSDVWKLFLRYQAQAERQYRRAVEELDRLRALRPILPNEPIPLPETEQIEPLTDGDPIFPDRIPTIPVYDPTLATPSPLPPVPTKPPKVPFEHQ